jgi:hypothetical protein
MRGKRLTETRPGIASIEIFRACSAAEFSFNPMDFVTLSKKFAAGHAAHQAAVTEEVQHVLAAVVATSEVFEAPNVGEFFYDGPGKKGRVIQVVRPNPSPSTLTLHHGTEVRFDHFDANKIGQHDAGFLGRGFYFSTDIRVANAFPIQMRVKVALDKPLIVEMKDFRTNKSALVRRALGMPPEADKKRVSPAEAKEITREAKRQGYDGVILDYAPSGYNAREVVVWNADQIEVLHNPALRVNGRKLSDYEVTRREREAEKAKRTRYGVFDWERANMYRPESALRVFKTEAAAQKHIDVNARPEDNWVTRSFEVRDAG